MTTADVLPTPFSTPFSTPGAHAEHVFLGLGRLVELLARLMRALLALLRRGSARGIRPEPDRERHARDRENRRIAEEIRGATFTTTVLLSRA